MLRSGNLVKITSSRSELSPFIGYCIKISKDRLKVFDPKSKISKTFPIKEDSSFKIDLVKDSRLRKARPYYIKNISSKKLKRKWIQN